MTYISPEAGDRIYQILSSSMKLCGRTVLDTCIYANYDSRNIYYRLLKGKCNNDAYIRIAIGANVPFNLFMELLEAANIQISPRFSKENMILLNYIQSNSTDKGADYDIDELNGLLNEANLPPL